MHMLEEEIKNIKSPLLKQAARYLSMVLENIISGSCDETEAAEIMTLLHPLKHDYFSDNDLMNVDQCCKYLGLGYNRAKFYRIVKEYGLQEVSLNNQKVGYRKSDIKKVKDNISSANERD